MSTVTQSALEPEISYLAKDYASFRHLMLDRLSLLLPGGVEDQPADLQVALVELLTYAADRLSYYQDAVATEAYLGTARSRVSLRRHARLLDYAVHEGCNARVWIHCHVCDTTGIGSDAVPVADDWQFSTDGTERVVFEPCHSPSSPNLPQRQQLLYQQHNSISFYPRDDEIYIRDGETYTLRAEATRAILLRTEPPLQVGDLLLLEATGDHADPNLRHVVRCVKVQDNGNQDPKTVEVTWGSDDALPFALPVLRGGKALAVARGNLVLADHGESYGKSSECEFSIPSGDDETCQPRLAKGMLTCAEPIPSDLDHPDQKLPLTSAAALMQRNARVALPCISLADESEPWSPRCDLLASDSTDLGFVVETENDGTSRLRFGDGTYGRKPSASSQFTATYRLGNGLSGNVSAETVRRVTGTNSSGVSVRNPLPAQGGQDPESAQRVRLFAPQAFRDPLRAITPADYAARAQNVEGVSGANADIRWTGSWYTVYLFVDPESRQNLDEVKRRLARYMDDYRMAGYDLEVCGPTYVPVEILLTIEVRSGFVANAVKSALNDVFSDRQLNDGSLGYFHTDKWSFGEPVYLSSVYAAALAVPGVASVRATTFRRSGTTEKTSLEQGEIVIEPHEIVQLDPKMKQHGCVDDNADTRIKV